MRQTRGVLAVLGCTLLVLAGCGAGAKQEKMLDDKLALVKEINAAFDTVKDSKSADDAKGKLDSLLTRMKTMSEEGAKLPPIDDKQKELQDKYNKELKPELTKLGVHVVDCMAYDSLNLVVRGYLEALKKF